MKNAITRLILGLMDYYISYKAYRNWRVVNFKRKGI